MPSGTVWHGGCVTDRTKQTVEAALLSGATTLLLVGPRGVGKQALAQSIADARGAPLDEIVCLADPADIRRWLFYARTPQGDGDPGVLGQPGRRIVFLNHLESLPLALSNEIRQAVQYRRYLDADGTVRQVSGEVTLIGAFVTDASTQTLQESGVVAQAFSHKVFLPGLSERPDDIEHLAKHLVGSIVPSVNLDVSAVPILKGLDYTDGNIDRLRLLLEAAALAASSGRIDAEAVAVAVASEARTAMRQMFFQGQTITDRDIDEWLEQFPADVRATAAEIVVAVRRRYYCEPSQWWSHLRYLFTELLREFGNEGQLRDRLVLASFQRPGKSEGRALADFTKANALRQGTLRGTFAALARTRYMPSHPIIVLVDDWAGSGEQIRTLLGHHKTQLLALAKATSDRGTHAAFRVLFVACYEPAAAEIDAFFSQLGLDGHTVVARRLAPTDRCVGSQSRVIPNEQARSAFEAFAQEVGIQLWPEYPLGWPPGGLLVVFPHDVPNNTLPLLWKPNRRPRWRPLISGVSRSRGRPS